MKDDLGDRMKDAEFRSRSYLGTRSYVVIRLDGKAFHTYTKGMKRPFDEGFCADMDETAKFLCENLQGAKCAFVQSDEISVLVSDVGKLGMQPLYKNQVQKIVSITASMAASKFNQLRLKRFVKLESDENIGLKGNVLMALENKLAFFDSRVMCFSDPVEAHNCFVWRQQDATRNSISMAAQSIFSHKQLHKKSANEMQEMMFQKGVNWNDYPIRFKRGGFVKKMSYFEDVDKTNIPKGVKAPDKVERSKWGIIDPPIFTQDKACTYSCIPIRKGEDVLSLWDVIE